MELVLEFIIHSPFLDAYKYLNHEPSDFPISFSFKDKILSLPIFPEIKNSQIKFISNVITNEKI